MTKTLAFCRQVDANFSAMTESTKKPRNTHVAPRQIVGISLSPQMAREVKAYAGEQGLSLRKLFEDMWQTYKTQSAKGKP